MRRKTLSNKWTPLSISQEVGERPGCFQDLERHEGTGRVLLSKFYGNSIDGGWQFSESCEYLHHLEALDETDPRRPTVVFPNHLKARPNCIALSSLYTKCCIDQCEELISHLEDKIDFGSKLLTAC